MTARMTKSARVCIVASVLMALCAGVSTRAETTATARHWGARQARGQNPPAGAPSPQTPGAASAVPEQISVADVQAMFEAMALLDAEKQIPLAADQYPAFAVRLKRLQQARGVHQRNHNRALNELRRLTNPPAGAKIDDAAVEAKFKELVTIDADGRVAIDQATDAIDQILSPTQRARFRILEDSIERKKLDFLTRVRK